MTYKRIRSHLGETAQAYMKNKFTNRHRVLITIGDIVTDAQGDIDMEVIAFDLDEDNGRTVLLGVDDWMYADDVVAG